MMDEQQIRELAAVAGFLVYLRRWIQKLKPLTPQSRECADNEYAKERLAEFRDQIEWLRQHHCPTYIVRLMDQKYERRLSQLNERYDERISRIEDRLGIPRDI